MKRYSRPVRSKHGEVTPLDLRFRNLTVTPGDPVDLWGVEGIVAAIDRGGASDWARIGEAVSAAPFGPVANEVVEALAIAESPGGCALVRALLDDARAGRGDRALARVRRLAAEAHLSRSELAARVGISRSSLNRYLRGAVVPSAVIVEGIAEVARTRRNELV